MQTGELEEIANYVRRTEIEGRINHRFARVFLSQKDIPIDRFKPQKTEVKEFKYFSRVELEDLMQHQDLVMAGTPYILTTVAPQLMDMIPK